MTVILHIGMPNAGSSAIQHRLWRNRQALEDAGAHYHAKPFEPRRVSSGNAKDLAQYLNPRKRAAGFSEPAFQRAFDKLLAPEDHPISIVSGEQLAGATPEMLARFRDEILRGRDIRIVAFIRDIYGHAHSCWMQQIKRQAYFESFERFCAERYTDPQCRAARRYHDAFGPERMRVIHYDSLEGDIFAAFLGAVGVSIPAEDSTPPINRSLSPAELGALRLCNRLHRNPDLSMRISDHLLAKRPDRPRAQVWSAQVAGRLEERYGADVAWVNARFFPGGDRLRVTAPVRRNGRGESRLEVWRDVVEGYLGLGTQPGLSTLP